ncbi:MAG: hypothetical protein KY434_01715 [Actinobacteria bacterium]|nr:hypothetical protein [Actinomycetota bacterium]
MVDNFEHALEGNDTIDYRAERMALLRLRRRLLKVWRSEETPPASRVTEAAIRGIEGLVCLLEELGEREASASRSG